MTATSVADLYGQVLRLLVKKHRPEMKSLTPIRTSSARFLLADKPVHPNGNAFVREVGYDGFFLESHKDYKNALAHLEKLAKRVGEPLEYLGN